MQFIQCSFPLSVSRSCHIENWTRRRWRRLKCFCFCDSLIPFELNVPRDRISIGVEMCGWYRLFCHSQAQWSHGHLWRYKHNQAAHWSRSNMRISHKTISFSLWLFLRTKLCSRRRREGNGENQIAAINQKWIVFRRVFFSLWPRIVHENEYLFYKFTMINGTNYGQTKKKWFKCQMVWFGGLGALQLHHITIQQWY